MQPVELIVVMLFCVRTLQSHQLDCCTALRVIEHAQLSWPTQDASVLQQLIEMLAVLEWNSPSYCCTQVCYCRIHYTVLNCFIGLLSRVFLL